jgi:ferredoxin
MCKKIKKVSIVPGCISCGTCESVCPRVFQVKGVAEVRQDGPSYFQEDADLVREAADLCPVSVIVVEDENQ